MAVGVLPNQMNGINGQASKVGLISPLPPSAVLPLHGTSYRPFFWETVPLCDLYSIAHIVLLPGSLQSSHSHSSLHSGVKDSVSYSHGHGPTLQPPSRAAEALASIGLGPPTSTSSRVSVFTAILPATDGYVSHSDFLRNRLQDCPFPITKVQVTVHPLQKYSAYRLSPSAVNSEDALASLIEHAAGVIQWADVNASVSIIDLQRHVLGLTHELRDRLNNAAWLTSQPIPRKRVALVRGRPNITAGGPVYRAAKALGLDLVVIDEDGHWLQADTEANKMHREAFLATDLTEDSGVVGRIVNSLMRYPLPIHGVFTLSDNFFVTVARVAEALGLPTSPASAFETSVDKYRSRLLQDAPGQTARVTGVAELEGLLTGITTDRRAAFTPRFPLIVKPTKGWSSECVSKVTSAADLSVAVQKATSRHGSAAVIEPFFDGPEIDVNFVLLDGEILFSEIADEPPCQADSHTATVHDTFSPHALTLPSALPAAEQAIAKATLGDILVNLGFRTGVFHVEARMVNSAYEYRDIDGVTDLHPKPTPPPEKPACKLIEINARPPGYRVSVPSRHTYGVDFFAAHMLAAVADYRRLRLVARPFAHAWSDGPCGAQYHSRLVYIPAPAAGTVRWPTGLSPCEELRRRRPDLADNIVLGVDYCVPGERVQMETDGARTYVAHLLLASHVGRREAIQLGDEVLRGFRIVVEGEEVGENGI
ncbi:hypothetical protein BT67DRAFT_431432 [Trichocladium antarcticum]|uniref:ATP-grasp domain-containing protein n=1 Tax=Trichocladium antarcticum TaxID=1450529 RepID=A0AAN6ZIC6_9PEZI|nr:hypothetical protein BT67DRAFT_431432 [Trichocladium antarcticum]